MKKSRNLILSLIFFIGIVFIVAYLFISSQELSVKQVEQKKTITTSKFTLPSGRQEYQILQKEGIWPKILKAVIDPPDVHVGDLQKLEIIVQDPEPIASVMAVTALDNSTKTITLKFVRFLSPSEITKLSYKVDRNGRLAEVSSITRYTQTAHAQESTESPISLYAGQWIVEDTHNTFYHTTFIVKDNKDRENSITIAWSDACGIPLGGNWTWSSGSCTISSTDGVDNGDATISGGTVTLNATFAFNPGHKITISGGSIAIGSGGQIKQTYLWVIDVDNDNYAANNVQYAQDTAPNNGKRRYLVNSLSDCNDSDSTSWRLRYKDADGDSYCPNSTQYCVGNHSGYRDSCSSFSDCNDSDSTSWRLRYKDADGDSYCPNSTQYCVGNHSGYRDSCTNFNDCYDGNANAYPGQTSYFTTHRGDGSFDYNCNGSQEKNRTSYTDGSCNSSACIEQVCTENTWSVSTPGCGQNYSEFSSCTTCNQGCSPKYITRTVSCR